jgi:hypothetical protein
MTLFSNILELALDVAPWLLAGLALDFSLTFITMDIAARAGESGELFPPWVASVALAVLILFTVRSVGRRFFADNSEIRD